MGFFSSKQRKQFCNRWTFENDHEEPTMPKVNITFNQAVSLKDQGLMTQEKFDEWISNNSDQVFTYRAQKDKPEVVVEVHNKIITLIEENALDLYNSGFKPSIIWHTIKDEAAITEEPVEDPDASPFA